MCVCVCRESSEGTRQDRKQSVSSETKDKTRRLHQKQFTPKLKEEKVCVCVPVLDQYKSVSDHCWYNILLFFTSLQWISLVGSSHHPELKVCNK